MTVPDARRMIFLAAAVMARGQVALAQAPALQVSPVMVHMMPGEMATTLSVTNAGDSETTVQLRTFLWRQDNGADLLTQTDNLEVSPPITEIPAGQTQVFRLVLRTPASGPEASYRVLLDQLPAASQPGMVRIALRVSIPVFAASSTATADDVVWHIGAQYGHAFLVGVNQGTQHARILNPVLKAAGRLSTAARPQHGPYILPGASQTWLIDDATPISPGSSLRLTAKSDAGNLDTIVSVAGR